MARRRRGRLVALEGIDGVGKSTLSRALSGRLGRRGWRVLTYREPADRALGRLAQAASVKDPWTGAIYFTLDRWLARPQLELLLRRADIVLSDRSLYSTLAYQGSALGAAANRRLEELGRRATVVPDLVVLLDLPPAEAVRRVGGRSTSRGPLERRRTLERVARRYRRLARQGGWLLLDARRPTGESAERVVQVLAGTLRVPRSASPKRRDQRS